MKSPKFTTKFHIEKCPYCGGDGGRTHPTQGGWERCIVCSGTGQIELFDVERNDDANRV